MRRHLVICSLLLAVAPLGLAAQTAPCSDSTIAAGRVGVVHIGMPVDSVGRVCSILRDTTETNEGESERIVYALVARDTLRMRVVNDAVSLIAIRRPGFITDDSIRVGTPLARFLFHRRPSILVGEGKVFLRDRTHCGTSFGLSAEAYRQLPKLTEASLATLPRSTRIDEILITGAGTTRPSGQCA